MRPKVFDEEGPEKVYAIRLAGSVGRHLVAEYAYQEEQGGPESADRWRDGILDKIQSLATFPGRCVIAPENLLYHDATVHQILFGRWRLLFTIHEADENDPPIVWIRHLRHGAQKPLKNWPVDED